ncbi:hypothetical protein VTN77DRAFT_8402 [Rasamsonia byssochlamydoides]|uniref:uncharacterized protein n=1 Tax=Rasamsonia byssochlamydoides TaxID=89139 RepID=UPI00374325DE
MSGHGVREKRNIACGDGFDLTTDDPTSLPLLSWDLLNIRYRSHKRIYEHTSEVYHDGRVESDRTDVVIDVQPFPHGSIHLSNGGTTQCLRQGIGFIDYAGNTEKDSSSSIYDGELETANGPIVVPKILVEVQRPHSLAMPRISHTAQKWTALYGRLNLKPRIHAVDSSQGAEGYAYTQPWEDEDSNELNIGDNGNDKGIEYEMEIGDGEEVNHDGDENDDDKSDDTDQSEAEGDDESETFDEENSLFCKAN